MHTKYEMIQDNRCTLPFGDHPGYTNDIDLTKKTVSLCCKIGKVPIDPITGILTPELVALRKSIIKNERNEQCKSCWETEDAGWLSLRKRISTHFTNTIDWNNLDPLQPIQHIGVMFSNKCQMMCSYCSPDASSLWEKSLNRTIPIIDNYNPAIELQNIVDISKLKSIKFTGGEPMLDNSCVDFLRTLPVDYNRQISINTNLSYGKSVFSKLLDIIDRHQNIVIATSLDSVGDNITRKFFNWELWNDNFTKLTEIIFDTSRCTPGSILHVTVTVGMLNYTHVPAVIEYLLKFKRSGINIMFDLSPITSGAILSLSAVDIDKTALITVSAKDQCYLTLRDRHMISAYNKMIEHSVYDPVIREQTDSFLHQHYSITVEPHS